MANVTVENFGGGQFAPGQGAVGMVLAALHDLPASVGDLLFIAGDSRAFTPGDAADWMAGHPGGVLIQWANWPWFEGVFGAITEGAAPQGFGEFCNRVGISIAPVKVGLTQPGLIPFGGEQAVSPGHFDFNPHDYVWARSLTGYFALPHARALITTTPQSNSGRPFWSAPTNFVGHYPNAQLTYEHTTIYLYTGIAARVGQDGLYIWSFADAPPLAFIAWIRAALAQFGHLAAEASGPTPSSPTSACTYTVRSGDTLDGIALAYHTTLHTLLALNPSITNPNRIDIGQVIRVPCGSSTPAPESGHPSTITTTTPTTSTPPSSTVPTVTTPPTTGTILGLPTTDAVVIGLVLAGAFLLLAEGG